MKQNRSERLWGIIFLFGLLYVFGVAGGLDVGTMTIGQAVIHATIGLSIMIGAAHMGGFMHD